MRQLLRRLAWLLARLLVVLGLCFGLLSSVTHSTKVDFRSDRIEQLGLPVFFNPTPVDLAVRVEQLIDRHARGRDVAVDIELQRLGGAAFPHIVPRLAQYPIAVRLRVAEALIPVMKRMGWRGAAELRSSTDALRFLETAWEERAADFNSSIVTRWVERLAQRPNPELYASVIEFDSFALPALMAALANVNFASDVPSAHRLSVVASRITGNSWVVQNSESTARTRIIVERWQRWWQLHASEYTVLRGPARWAATLSETRFGQWLMLATRFSFGTGRNDSNIDATLWPSSTRTLGLLFTSTLGGWLVSLIPSVISTKRTRSATLTVALGRGLFAIPSLTIVALLARMLPHDWSFSSALITTFVVAAATDFARRISPFHAPVSLPSGPDFIERRSHSPILRLLRQWQFAGHNWPFSLILVFVTERAFGIDGLSRLTVIAFRHRDLNTLMAITTTTATCLLLVEFVVQLRRKGTNGTLAQTGKT